MLAVGAFVLPFKTEVPHMAIVAPIAGILFLLSALGIYDAARETEEKARRRKSVRPTWVRMTAGITLLIYAWSWFSLPFVLCVTAIDKLMCLLRRRQK
jgi:hypothetical protein